MTDHIHDHDRGLQFDLETMTRQAIGRRRALAFFGTAGAAGLLAGCGGGGTGAASGTGTTATAGATTGTTTATTTTGTAGTAATGATGTTSGACIVDPQETQGPFPADGSNTASGATSNILTSSGVVRRDIRSSFGSSTTTAAGVPLTLTLNLMNTNASCAALVGYAVYLWHCNAAGQYSLYDLPAENYLRGVQVSDGNGQVTFDTIFPAAYSGRYPHIHFEVYPSLAVATSYRNKLLTSQLAMPRDIAGTIFSGSGHYAGSAANFASVTTSNDNVFGDNTAAQIAAMTPALTGSAAAGCTGSATIGLAI